MELPANLFKRAITSGKTPVGTWLMSGAPATARRSDARDRAGGACASKRVLSGNRCVP